MARKTGKPDTATTTGQNKPAPSDKAKTTAVGGEQSTTTGARAGQNKPTPSVKAGQNKPEAARTTGQNKPAPCDKVPQWSMSDEAWKEWIFTFHHARDVIGIHESYTTKACLEAHMAETGVRDEDNAEQWTCVLPPGVFGDGYVRVKFIADTSARLLVLLSVQWVAKGKAARMATRTSIAHSARVWGACPYWTKCRGRNDGDQVIPCCKDMCMDVPSGPVTLFEQELREARREREARTPKKGKGKQQAGRKRARDDNEGEGGEAAGGEAAGAGKTPAKAKRQRKS